MPLHSNEFVVKHVHYTFGRCMDGYYGNPLKREPCHPCMCPDAPTSSRYFAHSCYQDPWTQELVCNCFVGYSGRKLFIFYEFNAFIEYSVFNVLWYSVVKG